MTRSRGRGGFRPNAIVRTSAAQRAPASTNVAASKALANASPWVPKSIGWSGCFDDMPYPGMFHRYTVKSLASVSANGCHSNGENGVP